MTTAPKADVKQGLPIKGFRDEAAFAAWLSRNHATSTGLWLKIAKTGNRTSTLTYAQALEIALCQGWIDGQKAPLDAAWYLQRFTPRGARSKWSRLNCEKAQKLIAARRMQPAGLAAIEAAQRDGRWERAYEPQSRAEIPADLKAELDARPTAAAFFASLDRHNRYAILYRLGSVKKPQTRSRRLRQFVDMLERKEKIYP
jgi:uncharacterized protein YdeI (YjbR/CyaY-like superfamily)